MPALIESPTASHSLRVLAARLWPGLALAFAWVASIAAAQTVPPHPALSVAPVPDWVLTPLDPAADVVLEEDQTADLDYLVSERQVHTARKAAFVHFAYRVAAAEGLSQAAELSFTFDPAYETVAFHHIRLVREGRAENRLDLADFEVIRQERDRDRALYDGRLTAIHQLRDVRVGDIIEYAYTVTGSNPVFGDRYVDRLYLAWSKPMRQFRYRIVRPAGAFPAGPFYRVHGETGWPPETRTNADGATEWLWQRSPLPGFLGDAYPPGWHVSYSFLQLSEFPAWADVVAWALPLYVASDEHPALRAKIEELRAAAPDAPGRILAALAFVQEEIRYLGIELGANSHRPSPPADTLTRRFGDCKDKTLLLCTLLRALDIEADPALVNTGLGRSVSTPGGRAAAAPGLHASLPTPLAFDHVIARVRLPGGDTFWFDATRRHQTGPLRERTAHDFGQALIVRAGETGLVEMSRPAGAEGRLHEKITFTSRAFDQPVDLEIESAYDGDRATGMRAYLAGMTAAQLTRDYLNYYLQKFPGLTSRETVTWTDDRENNRIRVRELYSVPAFWTKNDAGVWKGELYPYAISDFVRAPGTQVRQAPLALSHPADTRVDIRIDLHETWEVGPLDLTVEDDFVRYVSTTRQAGSQGVVLTYEFATKEDHVPADRVPAYAASLAKIRGDLALTLSKDPALDVANAAPAEAGFRLNPWTTLLAAFTVGVGAALAWRVLRRRRDPAAPPPLPGENLPPIGGWLILFGLGVVVRCISAPVSAARNFSVYFDLAVWENLTAAGSSARNLPHAAIICAELVGNFALVFLVWIAAVLFFLRRREAPRWNAWVLVYGTLYPAADLIAVSYLVEASDPAEWKPVFQAFVGSCIWVPYLLVSERVKATFVR